MGRVDVRASRSAIARSILRPVAGEGAAVAVVLSGVGAVTVRLTTGPWDPWLARLPAPNEVISPATRYQQAPVKSGCARQVNTDVSNGA